MDILGLDEWLDLIKETLDVDSEEINEIIKESIKYTNEIEHIETEIPIKTEEYSDIIDIGDGEWFDGKVGDNQIERQFRREVKKFDKGKVIVEEVNEQLSNLLKFDEELDSIIDKVAKMKGIEDIEDAFSIDALIEVLSEIKESGFSEVPNVNLKDYKVLTPEAVKDIMSNFKTVLFDDLLNFNIAGIKDILDSIIALNTEQEEMALMMALDYVKQLSNTAEYIMMLAGLGLIDINNSEAYNIYEKVEQLEALLSIMLEYTQGTHTEIVGDYNNPDREHQVANEINSFEINKLGDVIINGEVVGNIYLYDTTEELNNRGNIEDWQIAVDDFESWVAGIMFDEFLKVAFVAEEGVLIIVEKTFSFIETVGEGMQKWENITKEQEQAICEAFGFSMIDGEYFVSYKTVLVVYEFQEQGNELPSEEVLSDPKKFGKWLKTENSSGKTNENTIASIKTEVDNKFQ